MIVYTQKMIIICALAFGLIITTAFNIHASVLEATDNTPKLVSGKNLLAIGVYEDSPGSSDATLIVKLIVGGKVLIDEGSPVKYVEPKRDIPNEKNPIGWTTSKFDDSDWRKGIFGVGYGDDDDNTVVGSKETTRSIYTRAYFSIPDANSVKTLVLNVDYDDSVVIWLNGVEIARSMPTELPGIPRWNDQCGDGNTHEASKEDPPSYESVEFGFKKGVGAKKAKKSPRDQLASEIEGAVIYARNRRIYKVVIGDWKPIELGRGEYARWGPHGKKIAVYDRRKIYVMNADGSGRKLVTDEAWQKSGCPIEFHTNGREIVFIRRNKRGLWAVNISDGKMRKLVDLRNYSGEPGISADGKRMVCRGNSVYAIDLVKKTDVKYSGGCASGISPDGKWIMNNDDGHKTMTIRSWDRKTVKKLRASICRSDNEWDNQTWSNHNDYVCAEGDGKTSDGYVINISANRGTRVTWVGNVVYPDLYVERGTQDARLKTQDRRKLPVLSLESWILGLLPAAVASDNPPTPPVALVNENYNRLTSRVLIRRVLRPTLANLDYAAYDSNVMHHDPVMYEPSPPPVQELSDLHFDKTLVPESLTDHLSATPLTPAEKASPMAWLPMVEYLMDWDFDPGYALAEAGWQISEDMWNDDKLPRPYQEISSVYLHKNGDGTHSLWVRIEFKPWVKFLKNVDDEDNDGYPEIYGMMDGRVFDEKVIKKLTDDYMQRVLSPDEITEWAADLAAGWYDKYNTSALEPEQIKIWPDAQTESEVKAELGELVLKQPDAVIRGKPFGKHVYSVFLVTPR